MKVSRRGFIGGLLFAPFAPALAKAGVLREPRSWLWSKIDVIRTLVDGYQVLGRGQRSDGSWFYVRQMIPLLGTYATNLEPLGMALCTQECRRELDSFLDARCNCIVGQWCDLHQYLRPPVSMRAASNGEECVQLSTRLGQGEGVPVAMDVPKRRADFMLGVEPEDGASIMMGRKPIAPRLVDAWAHVRRRSSYGKGLALMEKKYVRAVRG